MLNNLTKYTWQLMSMALFLFSFVVLSAEQGSEELSEARIYESIPALQEMKKTQVLRTDFVQNRKIKALKRPLLSSGKILLSRSEGLYWQMDQPFAMKMLMNKEQMIQLDDEGERSVVKAEDQAVLHSLSEIFTALFSGDIEEIKKNFDFQSGKVEGESWQLKFEPKSFLLAKVIKSVELSGRTNLEAVLIFEANGDSTEMAFANTMHSASPELSETEKKQLSELLEER